MKEVNNPKVVSLAAKQESWEEADRRERAEAVQEVLTAADNKRFSGVVVIGEINGRTCMSWACFTEQQLLWHLTAATKRFLDHCEREIDPSEDMPPNQ